MPLTRIRRSLYSSWTVLLILLFFKARQTHARVNRTVRSSILLRPEAPDTLSVGSLSKDEFSLRLKAAANDDSNAVVNAALQREFSSWSFPGSPLSWQSSVLLLGIGAVLFSPRGTALIADLTGLVPTLTDLWTWMMGGPTLWPTTMDSPGHFYDKVLPLLQKVVVAELWTRFWKVVWKEFSQWSVSTSSPSSDRWWHEIQHVFTTAIHKTSQKMIQAVLQKHLQDYVFDRWAQVSEWWYSSS